MGPGDVVGIGIHTSNALRGYDAGTACARARRPRRVRRHSLRRCSPMKRTSTAARTQCRARRRRRRLGRGARGLRRRAPEARVRGRTCRRRKRFVRPDGTCCRATSYMFGSVQTVRGCPKHCSFCSVWRTDGQQPRQRLAGAVVQEVVELRRLGFRFIAARRRQLLSSHARRSSTWPDGGAIKAGWTELQALRAERFELMEQLARSA